MSAFFSKQTADERLQILDTKISFIKILTHPQTVLVILKPHFAPLAICLNIPVQFLIFVLKVSDRCDCQKWMRSAVNEHWLPIGVPNLISLKVNQL